MCESGRYFLLWLYSISWALVMLDSWDGLFSLFCVSTICNPCIYYFISSWDACGGKEQPESSSLGGNSGTAVSNWLSATWYTVTWCWLWTLRCNLIENWQTLVLRSSAAGGRLRGRSHTGTDGGRVGDNLLMLYDTGYGFTPKFLIFLQLSHQFSAVTGYPLSIKSLLSYPIMSYLAKKNWLWVSISFFLLSKI
jgi:hypothetical protein